MPSISTSISSPGLRNTGGLRAKPTPGGVPVAITSPGSSVIDSDKNSINAGTPKISWSVFESCIVCPFNTSLIDRLCGSGISSVVTIVWPILVIHLLARQRQHHGLARRDHGRREFRKRDGLLRN